MNNVVVIPAYNESKRIGLVLDNVKKYCENIIVVDDGSEDNTYAIAVAKGVSVLKHITNLGKGAALKTGCDYAIHNGFENIIVMDSDGQHDATLIPKFFSELEKFQLVLGYRKNIKKNMPLFKRLGNLVINSSTSLLYGTIFKDSQSGYRAFTKEAYEKIRWDSTDYSMESEMLARAVKRNIPYIEIPIPTIYLEKYKGTSILDGIKIVVNLIKWRVYL